MELTPSRRLRVVLLATAAVLAAVVGVATLTQSNGDDPAAKVAAPSGQATRVEPRSNTSTTMSPSTSTTTSTTSAPATSSSAPTTSPSSAAPSTGPKPSDRPVRVKVPKLAIDAPVILLGLDQDQALEVPGNATDTGWWSGGSVPGTAGPAVLAGHVNYKGQAGVFQEIGGMKPGDRVEVTLDDGTATEFVVDRVEQHPKDAFPTDAVYGPTPGSELRLITCGGDFNQSSGHYDDNIVVFARAV